MADPSPPQKETVSQSLAKLPQDELMAFAGDLRLDLSRHAPPEEIVRAVEAKLTLIESLPRERMLEIVMWARRPVEQSASKLQLAREILQVRRTKFAGLSTEAMQAMALLHGCPVEPDDDRQSLRRKLKHGEGLWRKIRRKRRALVAKLVTRIVGDDSGDYRFLPEDKRPLSLKERIEEEGIVSGLGGKLRGAADDFVKQKLDEIEARIDRKLEEIDQRLAEWRDREIANRMKIIRITLMASVVVALLSLAYTWLRGSVFHWLP
ncbi:MAG: hypothetical protein BIFFINMI_01145 [Phycisphaerae bacterium]|nr:hypothetical protein [Phycisphaerae bacterium]